MKLSERDIATIEAFLAEYLVTGPNKLCVTYQSSRQFVSTGVSMLRKMGVAIPRVRASGKPSKAEIAEFRAWKAAQATNGAAHT